MYCFTIIYYSAYFLKSLQYQSTYLEFLHQFSHLHGYESENTISHIFFHFQIFQLFTLVFSNIWNLVTKITFQCVLRRRPNNCEIIENTLGKINFWFFLRITSCACFLGSGFNSIFHLHAQFDISCKLSFSCFMKILIS